MTLPLSLIRRTLVPTKAIFVEWKTGTLSLVL